MNHSMPVPLTFDELLCRCMGELEFARKILRDFFENSEQVFDEIETSLEKTSLADACHHVHRLKGTAATLAAKPLFESLLTMEDLLKASETASPVDWDELARRLSDSRGRFNEVREYAHAELL